MSALLSLWAHALAALLFAALAVAAWRAQSTELAGRVFPVALLLTALWAVAVAGLGIAQPGTRIAETLQQLGWLAVILILQRRTGAPTSIGLFAVYGVVAALAVTGLALQVLADTSARVADPSDVLRTAVALQLVAAIAELLILQQLFPLIAAGPTRTLALVLAGFGLIDANIASVELVAGEIAPEIEAARGIALGLLGGAVALGLFQRAEMPLRLSRSAVVRALSAMVAALYLAGLVGMTAALAAVGGPYARVVQTAFVFGSVAATLVLVSSPRLKARAKVMLAKHLFRHRYDYRVEWMRFTSTLGNPAGEDAASLDTRVVKAVADLVDAPAGLLLVPDGAGLGIGSGWNWHLPVAPGGDEALATYLQRTGRIIEIDAVRAGHAHAADSAAIPRWILDLPDAWALVPLPHLDRMQGAILLARPALGRALDWEDFDLLRIAGRQVGSYLAEAHAQGALAEARRFDEFNRRFAFIMHDIKNLVSQLSLVARNAERHADNPDFRADMVATLRDSAGRMNDLLARLSQHHAPRADTVRAIDLMPLLDRVAAARRGQHPIAVGGSGAPVVMADPARLETLLAHLIQNAIEASPPGEPVTIAASAMGDEAAIDVIDRGCGMSAAFVRDQLFKPFVSSKPGGFGIGAYEARQLATGMGGRVEVQSREGVGTRFRVLMPIAQIDQLGAAA